jgi:tetratricopeptide (TPR) repeat protein
VADNDDKKSTDEDAAKPGFDPKPVHLGGESIVDRLMPYRKKIGIMILLGFAVWGAIAVVVYIRNNKREKNTSRMAHVLDVASRDVRAAGEPEPTPDPNDTKKKPITYTTNKERAEAVLAELAKSGASASPAYRGSLLIQAGKLDEAIAEYKKAQDGTSLDAVLAREGLGIAIETKAHAEKDAAARQKGLEEALAVFKNMQPDEKGPRHAYALYHQGRILSSLGKNAEATEILKKAKEKSGESPLSSQIDERLASLGAS